MNPTGFTFQFNWPFGFRLAVKNSAAIPKTVWRQLSCPIKRRPVLCGLRSLNHRWRKHTTGRLSLGSWRFPRRLNSSRIVGTTIWPHVVGLMLLSHGHIMFKATRGNSFQAVDGPGLFFKNNHWPILCCFVFTLGSLNVGNQPTKSRLLLTRRFTGFRRVYRFSARLKTGAKSG